MKLSILVIYAAVVFFYCFRWPFDLLRCAVMKLFGLDVMIIQDATYYDELDHNLRRGRTHLYGHSLNGKKYGVFFGIHPFFFVAMWRSPEWKNQPEEVTVLASNKVIAKSIPKMLYPLSRVNTTVPFKDGHINIKRVATFRGFNHDVPKFEVTQMVLHNDEYRNQQVLIDNARHHIASSKRTDHVFHVTGKAGTGKSAFTDILASSLNGFVASLNAFNGNVTDVIRDLVNVVKPTKQVPLFIKVENFNMTLSDEEALDQWRQAIDQVNHGYYPHVTLVLVDNMNLDRALYDTARLSNKIEVYFQL